MKHVLRRWVLGLPCFLEITAEEYQQIVSARDVLVLALYFEQAFDLVIGNHVELEESLLRCAVEGMVHADQDYAWFQERRTLIARRIVNLLSACRLYLDQTAHNVSKARGADSAVSVRFAQQRSREYDNRLGYRAMEALRNHVQHRGSPISSISLKWRVIDKDDQRTLAFGVSPRLNTEELRDDEEFKKAVLAELAALGESIDLTPLIRQYIEGIAQVHAVVRSELHDEIQQSDRAITEAMARYKSHCPTDKTVVGLGAAIVGDDGLPTARVVQLFEGIIDYRRSVERKNADLSTLSKRFATGEAMSDAAKGGPSA